MGVKTKMRKTGEQVTRITRYTCNYVFQIWNTNISEELTNELSG